MSADLQRRLLLAAIGSDNEYRAIPCMKVDLWALLFRVFPELKIHSYGHEPVLCLLFVREMVRTGDLP